MTAISLFTTTVLIALSLVVRTLSAKSAEETPAMELRSVAADKLVISPTKPLSIKETELRKKVFSLCMEMLDAPAGKFGAHPSSADFPGLVTKDAPRITKIVSLKHDPPGDEMLSLIKPLEYSSPFAPTMYSTGLYAAPGEVIRVEIPKELAGKLAVQIGCHSDNLHDWVAETEDWRRMPLLVNHRQLTGERTEISNPFGGLIYITCPPIAEAWRGDLTISNAVAAPCFVLGQTTEAEWKQMLETTGAPWGEMGTDNIIIMLPVSVLKKIPNPESRMKIWDKIIGATMDLAQLPMPFYRAQRLVTDVHLGGGFMHSGYPIMVHHCPEVGLNTEDFIADPEKFSRPANGGPNWGFFHEIGHNMQNLDWVFDGTTEVSVNLFSLYCFDKVCGGRDAAHPGVSNESTQKMMTDFFSKPANFEKWKSDPFLGLLTFRLIQNDFGWDLFKKTFRLYHTLADAERPKNDQQKRDRLVRYLSESAERNFAPYFSAWGIPLSPEVKKSLEKFPVWFPYNFPVQKSGTGTWDAQTLGNHRAVVKVAAKADAIWVRIPWRRRDAEPEKKNIVVVEVSSGKKVANVLPIEVQGSHGDIVFQAEKAGTYGVYYMPFNSQGSSYPKATYQSLENSADPAWLAKNHLKTGDKSLLDKGGIPRATFVEIQAIDEFNAFTVMENAASPEEEKKLAAAHSDKAFLLFPEDRANPIRMTDHLPEKWILEGPKPTFEGEASRGEFFAFQLGLYAVAADISEISVTFSDLQVSNGNRAIPASVLRCFNTGGINWDGMPFHTKVSIEKGKVQPLWCGVQIPRDATPGIYHGQVHVKPAGMDEQTVGLALTVVRKRLANSGDNEPWRHSRLRWLDSTLALDDDIVRPFTPIRVASDTLDILGRRMVLGPSGLPVRVISFFTPEVTKIEDTPKPLLAAPLEMIVEDAAGKRFSWKSGTSKITKQKDGIVAWAANNSAEPLSMDVSGVLEFDGFSQFKVTVSAAVDTEVRDIRLEIPLVKETAKYMMGLGLKGGFRPTTLDWSWDAAKNQDSAWLGDANAGLQFKLKGENYLRPLLTNFYGDQPLNMPPAWFNGGKGGIAIRQSNDTTVVVACFSGPRKLKADEQLHFDFDLLLTPFKPINPLAQWNTRYFHSFQPLDKVMQSGANTVNIHHGNEANPYINYPFIHTGEMKDYIDEAHRKGLKVKIYYTIRELSNHAAELFALHSLGDEIFPKGPGGGHPWLQEHLSTNYIPAWCVPQWQDAAIINKGTSRWVNYYIEGLDWLVKNIGIDGLYLDDLAYDRTTMKRVRKVLDRGRPGSLIDFHSANLFNPRDGFSNCANVYLEHLPYIDRLWFGEYFSYDAPPEFWLIELSGIPYGLMGEMLQDGGNKWRGMIYGMTNRIPYQGSDPSPIWKAWDDFNIQESEMIGYWSPRCPIKTDQKDVLATAYVGRDKSMIAIASWAESDTTVRLSLNWSALGIDPARAKLTAPAIKDYQPSAEFDPQGTIPVAKGKGWLLLVAPRGKG